MIEKEIPPPRYEIRAIAFDEDDVQISYMHIPNDVRARGALVASHTITVSSAHPGWHNEIGDLKTAAYGLLTDALEDFEEATPMDMEDIFGDDDDERGLGE